MVDFDRLKSLGFDKADAARRFGDDDKQYEECLMIFFKGEEIEKLRQNFHEEDYRRAEQTAHTLKGATGNLSLIPLYKIYSDMVSFLREGNNKAAVNLLPRAMEFEHEYRRATSYKRLRRR